MHSHYTNKLLNIEDVIIKKIRHADTLIHWSEWEQTNPVVIARKIKLIYFLFSANSIDNVLLVNVYQL